LILATNTHISQSYRFIDNQTTRGKEYLYWLQIISNDSAIQLHGPIPVHIEPAGSVSENVPMYTILNSVYPNPVRGDANFEINVKEDETAELRIFNIRGQLVKEFLDIRTGFHNIPWDRRDSMGKEVASGIYFYRFTSPSVESVKRLVIIK
jgi:hypothetical protein